MTAKPFDAAALVAAMAPLLGLDEDGFSPEVVALHLDLALRQARLVFDPPPGDHDEPLPVYAP